MQTFLDQRMRSRPLEREHLDPNRAPPPPIRPEAKALLVPSIAVMLADRIIEDDELRMLARILQLHPYFEGVGPDRLHWLIDHIQAETAEAGVEAMLEAAAPELDMEARDTALVFAFAIAIADGHTGDEELRTILRAAEIFDIAEEDIPLIARDARTWMDSL